VAEGFKGRSAAADNNIAEKETIRMRADEQNKQNLLRQLVRDIAANFGIVTV